MALPDGPNQRWSLDFVADALSWGPGAGGKHLDRRPSHGPRTGRPDRPAWRAGNHRQRQRDRDDRPRYAGMDHSPMPKTSMLREPPVVHQLKTSPTVSPRSAAPIGVVIETQCSWMLDVPGITIRAVRTLRR